LAAIVRRRALATAAVEPTCVTTIRAQTWSAAVGGASIRGDGVLHSDNVDVRVVGKQRHLLWDKGLHREQKIVVVAPEPERLGEPQLLGAGKRRQIVGPRRDAESPEVGAAGSLRAQPLHPAGRAQDRLCGVHAPSDWGYAHHLKVNPIEEAAPRRLQLAVPDSEPEGEISHLFIYGRSIYT
jgi:hypothetical protein